MKVDIPLNKETKPILFEMIVNSIKILILQLSMKALTTDNDSLSYVLKSMTTVFLER